MNLNDVHRGIQKNRKRKRIGRGPGSGTGKTSGRGHKGHKSRSGYSRKPNFQGGAMPMFRRVPKRGFNNRWAVTVFAVNVGKLNDRFNDGDEVTLAAMAAKDVAKGTFDEVKILGQLDHENIVKYYEQYEDEKFIYLVMELITGGELFEKLQ